MERSIEGINIKLEGLHNGDNTAESDPEYESNCGKDFLKRNLQGVSAFERFQALNHIEIVTLLDEDVYVARYDGSEALPYLQISNISSYIIIERISETQMRTVKNVTDWANVEASSTPKRSVSSSTQSCELDITGSPLHCPFQNLEHLDLCASFQEPESCRKRKFPLKTYHGFPTGKARSLISHLRLILKVLQSRGVLLPPVWVVCNGQDNFNTAFCGVHVSEQGSGTCSITSSDCVTEAENLPTIDRINLHFSFGCLQPRFNTRVEATYEVMSRKDGRSSSLDICCRWTRPLLTLSPPGRDAFTTANLHLELSDDKSRARFLFLEFEILRNLIDGLKDHCLTWYQKKREKTVAEALEAYFANFNMEVEKKIGNKDSLGLDKIMEDKFLKMRPIIEFTDKIWDILKESESLAELSDGFKKVFKNISTGFIRPRIPIRNDTEFAVVCRDMVKGRGATPTLDKWKLIEMLIEIGLQKIKEDYVNVFQVCDLATTEQLAPYTMWSVKTLPFNECLTKLQKLHVVLQIVVILRTALNLPNSILCHFTYKTLRDLESKTDITKDFEFQVDTSSVKTIVNNIVPSIWTYEVWSESEEENPGCSKWMKFAVKKDEGFFKVESEDEKDLYSLLADNESSQPEEQTFYCLSVSRTEDILP